MKKKQEGQKKEAEDHTGKDTGSTARTERNEINVQQRYHLGYQVYWIY